SAPGGYDDLHAAAPAGDVDGDGLDDFLILAPGVTPAGQGLPGVVYLVHGQASFPPEVFLDAPPAGARITAFTSSKPTPTRLAFSASAGDLNGDGKLDLALGASASFPQIVDTTYSPGRVYVLFGGEPFPDTGEVDVEERAGLIIDGDEDGASLGTTVAFTG